MSWRYYSNDELADLLEITEEEFHRVVKRLIKRDYKRELKQMNVKNPDIWLNKNHIIRLVDPRDFTTFFGTALDIYSYMVVGWS